MVFYICPRTPFFLTLAWSNNNLHSLNDKSLITFIWDCEFKKILIEFFNLWKENVRTVKESTSLKELRIRIWLHLQLEIEPNWKMHVHPVAVETTYAFFNFKYFLSVWYLHEL